MIAHSPAVFRHRNHARTNNTILLTPIPVSASIDPIKHIVSLTFIGDTSYVEWEVAMDAVLANVEYVVGICVLSDRRDPANIPSTQHVREPRSLPHSPGRELRGLRGCDCRPIYRRFRDEPDGRCVPNRAPPIVRPLDGSRSERDRRVGEGVDRGLTLLAGYSAAERRELFTRVLDLETIVRDKRDNVAASPRLGLER